MKGAIYYAPEGTDPNDPKAWEEVSCAEVTGYSIGPASVPDEPKLIENYTADMTFTRVYGRGYGKTAMQKRMAEEWMEQHGMKLQDWQRPYVADILGRFEYTPQQELKDRLNSWLRGTYPGEPINWKGLS